MKQIAVMGLGRFGKSILEELLSLNVEVFIIDRDKEAVDAYRDLSPNSVVMDVLNVENLRKILPDTIDAVIIDMGTEAAILAVGYCAKLNIPAIIVKADSETLAEILTLVGATKVVLPNKEAAKRITPLLFSSTLLSYMPLSDKLSIAELKIPDFLIGRTLAESRLREEYRLNLVSLRDSDGEYAMCPANHIFGKNDIGLFSGNEADLNKFAVVAPKESVHNRIIEKFMRFIKRKES
jgi:trk system potassium uptake protein TrkA